MPGSTSASILLATIISMGVVAAGAVTPAQAQAIPEVRGLVGMGLNDAYGPGIGASAGVTIPFIGSRRLFVGARGMYHFGSEGDLDGFGAGTVDPTGSVSQIHAGLEVGATWLSSPLVIRTVGGVGMARVRVDLDSGESRLDGANTKLQYGPGVLVALPMSAGRFAGLEIRWLRVSDLDSTLAIYATLGTRIF